jgi:hypothetical protein
LFRGDLDKLEEEGPLPTDLILLYIIDIIFTPLMEFISPSYVIKLFKRKKIIKEGKDCKLTQKQANQ